MFITLYFIVTRLPDPLRRPGLSLYTQATESPQVAASSQVSASAQVAPPCLCRLLSHQTLLWHHRLGHHSLPRLRGMHSRLLVSGLPKSLPPLPTSPALPCVPCVAGRQHTAPHSSFPPTSAPLQTIHMDVSGPARVSGQCRERYFLLVFYDYTRYTTVFPLRSKDEDLPVLCLHSNRGGAFSSDLFEGEFALGTDVLKDRQEDFECLAPGVPRFASMLLAPGGDPDASDILTPRSYVEAITGPYSSQWQAPMDVEMESWKSTCTYVNAVPPSRANIVDGMWIFRVKGPPGSPPSFKARYVARGFSQRKGVD
ncbi:unnamed protein product [Closterium sp. NIES-54]